MAEADTYVRSSTLTVTNPFSTKIKINKLELTADYGTENTTGAGDTAFEFDNSGMTKYKVRGSGFALSGGPAINTKSGTLAIDYGASQQDLTGTVVFNQLRIYNDFENDKDTRVDFTGQFSTTVTVNEPA